MRARAAAVMLGLLLVSGALAGCGKKDDSAAESAGGGGRRRKRGRAGAPSVQSTLTIEAEGNQFRADDSAGKRVLEAKVVNMKGSVNPDTGVRGPVRFKTADCKLFQKGLLQLNLQTPEATWDGELLVSEKPTHATTPDGKTVMDAKAATWTQHNGGLQMKTAKVQSLENGKTAFTVEGPQAEALNDVVTLPAGGVCRSAEGQTLTANRIRWWTKTKKVEATGNVVLTDAGTVIRGQHLLANTLLKRGRLTGRAQVKLTRLPLAGPSQRTARK